MARRTKRTPAEAPREAGQKRSGARPFWSGTISFGLVSVPVNVYPSTRSAALSLRMLAPDGAPLQRRYVCGREERDVEREELIRGYEVEPGEHVLLSDEELESVSPRKSRDIDLRLFVPAEQLDPFLFERAYVLTPAGDSTKPYRLLAEVMEAEQRVGVATFVMRDKEHLVAIVARRGILWAETLRFAGELRSPEDVGLAGEVSAAKEEVDAFRRAIRALQDEGFEREELADERLEALKALVERKRRRKQDLVEAPRAPKKGAKRAASDEDEEGEPPDLFDTIRRSLSGADGNGHEASDGELERLSKKELYDRAKARDLPGRSEMTKEELVRALRAGE